MASTERLWGTEPNNDEPKHQPKVTPEQTQKCKDLAKRNAESTPACSKKTTEPTPSCSNNNQTKKREGPPLLELEDLAAAVLALQTK